MHLVFGTRGINAAIEQMKIDLQAQRYLWKRKNLETGKEELAYLQGALIPIQLWEYVFPEKSPTPDGKETDNLNELLYSLDVKHKRHFVPKSLYKFISIVRRIMGLSPIPDAKESERQRMIHLQGISIIPIGYKKDEVKNYDFGTAGKYHQEGL